MRSGFIAASRAVARGLADRASLYGLATKAFQAGGGLVSAVLVLRYFSPEVQGYYYTFANVLALQVFVELGLSTVITTFAAHEWSKLSLAPDGSPQGDRIAADRLKSLTRKVAIWYALAALIILVGLPLIGLWFFAVPGASVDVQWWYPWITLCLVASINFVLTPAWAILLGCGQVVQVNAYRMVETVLRYATLWILIYSGASLWSAVGAAAAPTLAALGFLWLRYSRFLCSLLERGHEQEVRWRHELLPLQSRIALSWISGYFAFSLFTPAVFYFLGPAEAGRMGLTWAVISGLSGVAGTWLQVQTPAIAMLAAKKDFRALDGMIARTAAIAVVVFALGSIAALAGLAWSGAHYPHIAARFLPGGVIAIFLFAECLHQISMAQSTYLRAFKEEPFFALSMTSGAIIGTGTLSLTPAAGSYGPALSYLLGVFVALAWGTHIFIAKRRERAFVAQR
jgi:O-antigen/teichoic acid export membrane protein